MPVFDSDFVKKIAACAAPQIESRVFVAEDENEVFDQACQSALAYWTLGWHDEEIESVLEDEGFPEKMVEKAMEYVKERAQEITRDGPFAVYEAGQLVRLNNGGYGVLREKQNQALLLQIGSDLVRVVQDQIDAKATAHLTKAYQMRMQATQHLRLLAEKDDLEIDFRPYIKTDEIEHPFPQNFYLHGPGGSTLDIADVYSVQEALGKNVEKELLEILETQEKVVNTKAELDMLQEEYKHRIAELQQQESEQVRELQNQMEKVFSAIENLEGISEEQYARAYELQGRFVLLQQVLQNPPPAAGPKTMKEYKAILEKWEQFISEQAPNLQKKLRKQWEKINQEVIRIKQPWYERLLAIFFPTKEHRKKLRAHQAQESRLKDMWESFKNWVDSVWQATQDIFSSWTNDVDPETQAQITEIDSMIAEITTMQERMEAQAATQTALSASTRRC